MRPPATPANNRNLKNDNDMMKRILILLTLLSFASGHGSAATPESYPLSVRDRISFFVLNEAETEVEQRIDGEGRIRLPYIGTVRIEGMTARQAESTIEEAFVAREIYIDPQVTIRVTEYAIKEVAVLGEVKQPGTLAFPIEAALLDIREAISMAGGFTNIAKTNKVVVTRQSGGRKETFEVDVEEMLEEGESETFMVEPGDVIFVPERFF